MYSARDTCCRLVAAQMLHNQVLQESNGSKQDPDAVTKQYGLEAGIFSAFKNGSGATSAKDLLKRYGSAYLLTSISLALISFSLCYFAVDAGVDIPSLLARFGLSVDADSTWDKGGTVALAYAAHKALSPVRFPPTVALTPVVAQRLGNRGDEDDIGHSSSAGSSDKS